MMAIPVASGDVFSSGTPVKLFTDPQFSAEPYHRAYDVAPDGKFLMIRTSQKNAQNLGVVVNWGAEIQRLSKKK
jgi:hypothetical protein